MKEEKIIFPAEPLLLEGFYAQGAMPGRGVVVTHPHPLMGGSLENNVVETLVETFFDQGYTRCASISGASAAAGETTTKGWGSRMICWPRQAC